ncbi:hypothetical protein [Stieleria varia]|uniref:hypothetical protein n=1 Tax=Stieleria varia TaxID=2528005 RepID=UPI0011B7BF36|nr:hypothetical protein [Stieleria varia]
MATGNMLCTALLDPELSIARIPKHEALQAMKNAAQAATQAVITPASDAKNNPDFCIVEISSPAFLFRLATTAVRINAGATTIASMMASPGAAVPSANSTTTKPTIKTMLGKVDCPESSSIAGAAYGLVIPGTGIGAEFAGTRSALAGILL